MNSQKMIRLSVIAALAGVYGSAFAGTAYDKGTNFIDQTYENVVGTQRRGDGFLSHQCR